MKQVNESKNSEFSVISILDMVASIGESKVCDMIDTFSCERNRDIERFLKHNAIDFAKKKISITYLVVTESFELVAYFTLSHKPICLSAKVLPSNSLRKKIQRHATFDESKESYDLSAFLIAQFGKNDACKDVVTGIRLMDFVFEVLLKVQNLIGGGVVFLECEDNPNLLSFYQNEQNGFKLFSERETESGKTLLQLLKVF